MRWKEFILMPAALVAVGILWITWEAKQTKSEQEELFQVPVSDDPQVYVDFMRQMTVEFGYIRSAESWHYRRVYKSMREATDRLRALLPPGESLPPFAAFCDINYRAADSYTFDRLSADEVQAVLDDFETFLGREDATSVLKDAHAPLLPNALTIIFSLLEDQKKSKKEMLDRATRLESKIAAFHELTLQESVKNTIVGFRNRISLLEERYRLTGDTLTGKTFDTMEFEGRFVFIKFWSTTCKPCVAELPTLLSIYEAHQSDLAIVGVSKDRSKRMLRRFAEDHSIPWPQLWIDREVGNLDLFESLGVNAIPYSILLDRTGRVVDFNVRADELEESIRDLPK